MTTGSFEIPRGPQFKPLGISTTGTIVYRA